MCMNLFKNYKSTFAVLLGVLLIGTGCEKDLFEKDYPGHAPVITMPQAVEGRNTLSIQLVDEPYVLPFGASWSGLHLPDTDIPVKFQYMEDHIEVYNLEHKTDYRPLPPGSYTVSGLESVIKKGTTSSAPLEIKIESKKLDRLAQYMIPIQLVSAAGHLIDSALQTVYFKIDDIIRKETDVTGKGQLTVSDENASNANENSSKLVDGNIDTKYLTFDYTPELWLQLTFAQPMVLGAYTLTSANDAQDRDPKSWKLSGSNDGSNWEELDVQNNVVFSGRKMTQRFEFENETAYTYYRLNVVERFGSGNGLFQLAEWRVISFQ